MFVCFILLLFIVISSYFTYYYYKKTIINKNNTIFNIYKSDNIINIFDINQLKIVGESKRNIRVIGSGWNWNGACFSKDITIRLKGDFEKIRKVKAFSKKYNCVIVIKGAHTMVIYDGKGYVNTTGNPGMATAGTGDTLTGIIAGLVAQGYRPLDAAIFGVYIHGKAGDIAVEKTGYQALTASHIIDNLGEAFLDLFKVQDEPNVAHENEGGTPSS